MATPYWERFCTPLAKAILAMLRPPPTTRGPAADAPYILEETIEGVLGDGRYRIGGDALATKGRAALRVGQRVHVFWRGGKRERILTHQWQRAQAGPPAEVVGGVEELFLVANGSRRDVYYRNAGWVGRLIEGATLSGNPETVNWGTRDTDFVVRLEGYVYRIYRLSRPQDTVTTAPVTASFVREDTLPADLELFRLEQSHTGDGEQSYWVVPCIQVPTDTGFDSIPAGGPTPATAAGDSYARGRTDRFLMTPALFSSGVATIDAERLDETGTLVISGTLGLGTDASAVGGTTVATGSQTERQLGQVAGLDGPGVTATTTPATALSMPLPIQAHAFVVDVTHGQVLWSSAVPSPALTLAVDTGRMGFGNVNLVGPASPVFTSMPYAVGSTSGVNWEQYPHLVDAENVGAATLAVTGIGPTSVTASIFDRGRLPMFADDEFLLGAVSHFAVSGQATSVGLTTPGAYSDYAATGSGQSVVERGYKVLACHVLIPSDTLTQLRLLVIAAQENWHSHPSGADGKGIGLWIIDGTGTIIATVQDWTRTYEAAAVLTATPELVLWAGVRRADHVVEVIVSPPPGVLPETFAAAVAHVYRGLDVAARADALYETREPVAGATGLRFVVPASLTAAAPSEDTALTESKDLAPLGDLVPVTRTLTVGSAASAPDRIDSVHVVGTLP